ncbi:trypco2 family protein [Streptomyces sp. NPDC093546]|uniref:trypco2 family protein n=1 Tax=Streptomyces sp. NPDC093546 TaxID=3366040 RepID=UPI00382DD157
MADDIELTEAVRALRDELAAAAVAADGERIRFEVDDITLEFEVELRRDAKAKAGFKAWVVSGDLEGSAGKRRTQRVSLTLKAKDVTTGGSVRIGNDREADLSAFEPAPGGRSHG